MNAGSPKWSRQFNNPGKQGHQADENHVGDHHRGEPGPKVGPMPRSEKYHETPIITMTKSVNAQEHRREDRGHVAHQFAHCLVVLPVELFGQDGDKRRRERPLAQQLAENIRHHEGERSGSPGSNSSPARRK